MGRRQQDPLRAIGKGFANAKDPFVIGRNEAVAAGKFCGDCQTRDSGGGCQAGGDESAASEFVAHESCFLEMAWPAIMARIRFVNPARMTMATWTSRKSTSRFAAKK